MQKNKNRFELSGLTEEDVRGVDNIEDGWGKDNVLKRVIDMTRGEKKRERIK